MDKLKEEWKKKVESRGFEGWNLSKEEKKQLSCTERITWEEVKSQSKEK